MELGTIATALLDFGYRAFNSFNIIFGDVTINGWLLLIGGAVVLMVVEFLGRIFQ